MIEFYNRKRYKMPDIIKRNKKFVQLFLVVVLICMHAEIAFLEEGKNDWIQILNGRVSVNVKDVTLASVLARIREKTGIEFILDEDESERNISVSFQSLPIDIALERILFRLNHAFYFNADGQIHKVIIVGAGKSSVALSELEAGQAALESRRMKIARHKKSPKYNYLMG
jgi:type II secretory pathway component GspD/PulD (secretin)